MFQYRLEPLLRFRKSLEERQQRSLATANKRYLEKLKRLNQVEDELVNARETLVEKLEGIENPSLLRLYYIYFAGSKFNIEANKEKVDAAMQIMDMERETLIERVKSRRIIELHRERMKEKHLQEESRKELAAFDEIATSRFIHRKQIYEQ